MRVGMISQWYDPEPGPAALPAVLARSLIKRGHDVQVLTAYPNYPTGEIAPGYTLRPRMDEVLDGVDVRRTAVYPNHDASALRRVVNYTSFGLTASILGVDALQGCDAIWVNYSPITVAWPMWTSKLLYHIPHVLHVLDLWPDTLFQSGFGSTGVKAQAMHKLADSWCNAMYRTSHATAYISPSVGSILEARGVPKNKLAYVPMWADEDVFFPTDDDLRADLNLSPSDVVLLYAGAMGEAQDLSSLLDAAAKVSDPKLKILLAGSGISESLLRSKADSLGLTNTRFLGRVRQEQMTRLLGAADISYVSLRSHPLSNMTMPSKVQAGLASGTPLLVVADGDAQKVVTDHNVGLTAQPGNADSIAQSLRQMTTLGRAGLAVMGQRARDVYTDQFSIATGVDRIEALLLSAAGREGVR